VIFPVPPEEEEAVTLSERCRAAMQSSSRERSVTRSSTSIYRCISASPRNSSGANFAGGRRGTPQQSHGRLRLNGGIHDSFNLTEKLGKVCRGEADPSLLDVYVRQRRTVNLEYVQEHSIRNLSG